MIGLDLMGAKELTDAELANVDRALTPAEQKRVDAYQARLADRSLAETRADAPDAPRAEMTVTREGAVLTAAKPTGPGLPLWVLWLALCAAVLAGAGVIAGAARRLAS